MDVPTILSTAEDISNVQIGDTDLDQISTADALKYLNIVYHDIEGVIVGVDEDFFEEEFYADTVANQSEYTIPQENGSTPGIHKITGLEIKRKDTETYRSVVRSDELTNRDSSADYLKANLSQSRAFFDIRRESVFLYPEPTEAVTDGLRIRGIVGLVDLASDGAESTVFPNHPELKRWHQLIALGMTPWILRHRNAKDATAIANAKADYRDELSRMVGYLQERDHQPTYGYTVPSTYFMH